MEPVLSPEVAALYALNTLTPGEYIVPGFGTIDLTTMGADEAARLVNFGFPYLTPVSAPAPDSPVGKGKAAVKTAAPDAVADVTGTDTSTEQAPTP